MEKRSDADVVCFQHPEVATPACCQPGGYDVHLQPGPQRVGRVPACQATQVGWLVS